MADNLPEPVHKENLEQRQLFEEYVKLGSSRNLRKLLEFTDRSFSTIERWSRIFHWGKRAKDLDQEIATGVGFESPSDHVARKRLILDLLDVMIKDVAVLDEKGKITKSLINAKTVFDLKALIEIREAVINPGKKGEAAKQGDTNIDKAIFIIKK